MEVHQVKPDLKRHHDNDESKLNKSQRLDSTVEPEDAIKIVDLNNFCLIKIFENLDLRNLLNVAVANERLQPAAIYVYQRKFGKNPVTIRDFSQSPQNEHDQIDNGDSKIRISGLKTCLRYLRCLGSSVSDLVIDYFYDSGDERHEYVHQYINDYCAETLARIKFVRMPNIAIGQFQKIFGNIQAVDIADCDLGQQLSTFVKCFPNVRSFKVRKSFIYDRFILKPFQYLEHLSLQKIRCRGFETRHFVADLLNDHHDLKSLELIGTYSYGWQLLNLIKDNPSLTKLIWSVGNIVSLRSAEVQHIAAEHPALIELELPDYRLTAADAIALVRQLNSLTKIRFSMWSSEYSRLVSQLDDEWKATRSDDSFGWNEITLKRKI